MARQRIKPPTPSQETLRRLIVEVPEALSPHWPGRSTAGSDPLADAVRRADGPDGYLHWDQVRHKRTPPGRTSEDVWAVITMRRGLQARPLELLRQKDGTPFTLVESPPYRAALHRCGQPTELWSGIAQLVDVTSQSSSSGSATRQADGTYRLMAAIEEAHHSSAIEGAVTTRRQSRELIRSGRPPRDKSERMVLNVFRTAELLEERLSAPLDLDLLFELHSTVTDGTLEDAADRGRFRQDDSIAVVDTATGETVYTPPPAAELPARFEQLCEFANASTDDAEYLHPIARAILVHHQLAYDHPFADGNGRTARALFQWLVLKAGFPWFRLVSISRAIHDSKARYYRAFQHVQTTDGDVTYFVRDQLRCIEREYARLREFVARRTDVASWLQSRRALEEGLNDRQLALLAHALDRPESEFSVPEHQRFHGVSQPTAYKDVQNLIAQGLLQELRREGRKVVYGPTAKLRELAREKPKGVGRD